MNLDAKSNELVGLAVIALFGVIGLVILYMVWKTFASPHASPPKNGVVEAIDRGLESVEASNPGKRDFTWTERMTITSPTANSFSQKRVELPLSGELKNVTARPTAADTGDYFQLEYAAELIIDGMPMYANVAGSHDFLPYTEKGLPVREGYLLILRYWNAGATSKTLDVTFHLLV